MRDTIALAWLREGIEIGRAQRHAKVMKRLFAVFRSAILREGRRLLGEPTESQNAALQAICDFDRLEILTDLVFEASSWDELFRTA